MNTSVPEGKVSYPRIYFSCSLYRHKALKKSINLDLVLIVVFPLFNIISYWSVHCCTNIWSSYEKCGVFIAVYTNSKRMCVVQCSCHNSSCKSITAYSEDCGLDNILSLPKNIECTFGRIFFWHPLIFHKGQKSSLHFIENLSSWLSSSRRCCIPPWTWTRCHCWQVQIQHSWLAWTGPPTIGRSL